MLEGRSSCIEAPIVCLAKATPELIPARLHGFPKRLIGSLALLSLCAYMLSRNRAVTTQTFKLNPQNSTSASANSILRFSLPSNTLLNLKSLKFLFRANCERRCGWWSAPSQDRLFDRPRLFSRVGQWLQPLLAQRFLGLFSGDRSGCFLFRCGWLATSWGRFCLL